jgi:amidophosphoribosyltransferase
MKYIKCKSQENFIDTDVVNYVAGYLCSIWATQEVLDKIAEMLSSPR